MTTASIIISSYNRLPLFKRTLWSIANRPPSCSFEVVVCDDESTDDTLSELRAYSAKFPWKFIRFNREEFTGKTGLKKFFNNPAVTNNLAVKHSVGGYIFQQGNEVIAWKNCYDQLLTDVPGEIHRNDNEAIEYPKPFWIVNSTTFDIPQPYLGMLDSYGTNLNEEIIKECQKWPLQSTSYRSDVTNYISLSPRTLWEKLGGYDERYYAGIAAEDSDFVRRARTLPGFEMVISDALSLHQSHRGKTRYSNPPPNVITQSRWDEGVANNRCIYDNWDGTHESKSKWDWGTIGTKEVITNV